MISEEYDEFRVIPLPQILGIDIDWPSRANQVKLQTRADMASFTKVGPEALSGLFEHMVNLARNNYADASTFAAHLTDGETRVMLAFIIGASAAGA